MRKEKELKNSESLEETPSSPAHDEEISVGEGEAEPAEKTEVEQLQEQLGELNDRYLRLMAEYDNFRKRSAKEREELFPTATASTVEKFLPILDSLERAECFEHGTEEFAKGFEMICQNFRDIMEGLSVEAIGEVGEPFDPEKHNAVMHIEDEELGENVVAQVLQKGYKIGNRVIRYAMVQTAN